MALRSELKQKITALLESGAGATTDQFDDSYHLGAVLGEGGYAKVYKCTHKSSGADRAVKVTTKGGHHKECAIARAEADILSSLSHSHIIDIYDFYENPTSIHLVMELVEGGELFYKIVDLKHYTEETASRLMKNVLSGVAFMHQSGVAHRDLKPENLLLVGTKDIGLPGPLRRPPLYTNPNALIQAVLKKPDFFFGKDSPQGPPTANRQPPTAANRQPPPTANRRQPPTANRRQPPTTANRHQPPKANTQPHQLPIANHQLPPTATNRQPPPTINCPPPTDKVEKVL